MTDGLIFFDLDGTLIDSRADLAEAVNDVRRAFSHPPLPLETVVSFVGDGAANLLSRSLADAPDVPIADALACFRTAYSEHLHEKTTLYPGVSEGLETLSRAGYAFVLLTNKPQAASERLLVHFRIRSYFAEIIGGGSAYPLKPDPSGAQAMLRRFAVPADRTWILGDHYTDLSVAQALQFRAVYAAYGFGNPMDYPYYAAVQTFPDFVERVLAEDRPSA